MIFFISALTGHLLEICVLFGVVLIHELGHVTAASIFRFRVKEIQLLPFGGVAVLDEIGTVPSWQEVLVIVAGPLQNVLMFLFALAGQTFGFWSETWTNYFVEVNLMILLFNLLPILPLDGGKLMQILCGLWMSYYQTLHVTFIVSILLGSLMIAVSLGLWGTYGIDLNLLMIGIFLFVSNWSDYRHISYIFIRFLMGREISQANRLSRGVAARPIFAPFLATASEIVKLLKRDQYHVIYLCNEQGIIQHTITEQQVIHAYLSGNDQHDRVKSRYFRYNKRKLSERRI